MNPHDALTISSSVPPAARLTGLILRDIFASGVVPEVFWPHLNQAFAEWPVEMLARLLDKHRAGPERTLALDRTGHVAAAVEASDRTNVWLRSQ